jgi:AcrR family transcriptional regulator
MLEAAEAIVLGNGARHMTLDAVAAKAGISKGGLLYHFPTKESLLKAMLERLGRQLDETWEKKAKAMKPGPRREIKAFVLAGSDRDPRKERIGSALLAAVAHDPKLLRSAKRDFGRRLRDLVSPDLDFKRVAVIFFALHGLVMSELLALSPLTEKERRDLVQELLRLAET